MNKTITVATIATIFVVGMMVQAIPAEAKNPQTGATIQIAAKKVVPISPNGDAIGFEIISLVQIPKNVDPSSFTVETSLEILKPDGTPLRAKVSTTSTLPENVGKGENNHSVYKVPVTLEPERLEELIGELVRVVVTSELKLDERTVDVEMKDAKEVVMKNTRKGGPIPIPYPNIAITVVSVDAAGNVIEPLEGWECLVTTVDFEGNLHQFTTFRPTLSTGEAVVKVVVKGWDPVSKLEIQCSEDGDYTDVPPRDIPVPTRDGSKKGGSIDVTWDIQENTE